MATTSGLEKRRNKAAGKATLSTKGKGRAVKRKAPQEVVTPTADEMEWDTPSESEAEEINDVSVVSPPVLSGSDIQGPSTSGCSSRPRRAFGCVPAHPRNEHVTEKQRKKIREGEFVEFKLLLPLHRDEKPTKKFSLVDGMFEEVEDNSSITFYSWIDAYVIFMSVHLEFYPADVQGMLRHLEIVKGFHASGKDGVEYDYLYRRLKSRNADIVWGEYIAELANGIKDKTKEASKLTSRKPFPAKKKTQWKSYSCNQFNSAAGCQLGSKCRYPHKCRNCMSPDHPSFRCSKR